MMAFLAKGSKTYKLRVNHPDGRHAILTTGCRTAEDARDVEAIVHRWEGRKGKKHERLDVIDALITKRMTLPDAIDAYHASAIDALLERTAPVAPSIDLMPLLDQWVADKQRSGKGTGQAEVYREQMLRLIPQRPLTLDLFNRRHVWALLDALDVDAPTKNRYRTAASSLAKFLVKREVLDHNFVRDITGYGENDPRLVYYEIADAKRLIAGMPQPYAAVAALALGFCAEWGAIERALVGDITLKTDPVVTHVRGSKRAWRDRYVPLVPELAWTLDYIRPAVKGKTSAAAIIDAVPEWRAIDVQRATARELEIRAIGDDEFGEHSLHDWRHTHAVALLRFGYDEQIAAAHLGHKNTDLVRKVYGRFRPTKHDYAKAKPAAHEESAGASDSTDSATTSKHNMKRGGVR